MKTWPNHALQRTEGSMRQLTSIERACAALVMLSATFVATSCGHDSSAPPAPSVPTAAPTESTHAAPIATAPGPRTNRQECSQVLRSAEPALVGREKRVAAEINSIASGQRASADWGKEWAGTYTHAGRDEGTTISLAPDSGVVWAERGNDGLNAGNHGEIAETHPDGIRFTPSIPPKDCDCLTISDRLYFVQWGHRRYVVPESQMLEFVSNFNEGGLAREYQSGIAFKRPAEDNGYLRGPQPDSKPQLPENYASMIIDLPLRLVVEKLAELSHQDGPNGTRVLTGRVVFRTDDGSNAKVGMSFPYEVKDGGGSGVVRVDKITDGTVEATFTIQGTADESLRPPTMAWPYDFPGSAPDPSFRSR